jgi:hypothetical protein
VIRHAYLVEHERSPQADPQPEAEPVAADGDDRAEAAAEEQTIERAGGADASGHAEVATEASEAAQSLPRIVATMVRFASREGIADLLARPQIRARIEQGLADLDAGLDDGDALDRLLGELDREHGPVDRAIRAEVGAERWLDGDPPRG